VRRLLRFAPHADGLTRLEGEEFALALDAVEDGADAERFAGEILEAFRRPVVAEGYELHVMPHIGVSLYPDHAEEAVGLLDQAHVALEHAAGPNRAGYRLFEPDMQPRSDERRPSHRYLSD
ncbi:MAG TPA: diguanylate cyclase, partial [Gammaproteobacteria bacterium]|nr:diguanylate cyclase [Gammaproteobacteria bacterium]